MTAPARACAGGRSGPRVPVWLWQLARATAWRHEAFEKPNLRRQGPRARARQRRPLPSTRRSRFSGRCARQARLPQGVPRPGRGARRRRSHL